MSKKPDTWMPFYWGDYLRDTGHLSAAEHGAYLMLIGHYWTSGAPLPSDDVLLARIARMTPKQWKAAKPVIAPFFQEAGGKWTHKRIAAELEKWERLIEAKAEAGRASAAAKAAARAQRIAQQTANSSATGVPTEPPTKGSTKFNPSPSPSPSSVTTEVVVQNPEQDPLAFLEAARLAARIPPGGAVNEIALGQRWLGLGISTERIIETIRGIASRPSYNPERISGLAYFTPMIREAAAIPEPTKTADLTPEQQQDFLNRYVKHFARDGVWRGHGPKPGEPGCLASPEVLKAHGFLDAPQSAGNGRRSASAGVPATTPAERAQKATSGELRGNSP